MKINCARHQVHPALTGCSKDIQIVLPKKRKFCISFQWIISIISAIIFTLSLSVLIALSIRYLYFAQTPEIDQAKLESCKINLAISFIVMLASCVVGCVLGGLA